MSTWHSPDLIRQAEVEDGVSAGRVCIVPRGFGFGAAATTGVMAAGLVASSTVFAMRLDPGSARRAFIERIRLEYTTNAAFTVPITMGRRLAILGAQLTANPTGGSLVALPAPKHGISDSSEFSAVNGGDVRIATTTGLSIAGTANAAAFREFSLAHLGAAGAFRDCVFEFAATETHPYQIDPGQALIIRNPVAFDAGGTWQLSVAIDWSEAPALDYA